MSPFASDEVRDRLAKAGYVGDSLEGVLASLRRYSGPSYDWMLMFAQKANPNVNPHNYIGLALHAISPGLVSHLAPALDVSTPIGRTSIEYLAKSMVSLAGFDSIELLERVASNAVAIGAYGVEHYYTLQDVLMATENAEIAVEASNVLADSRGSPDLCKLITKVATANQFRHKEQTQADLEAFYTAARIYQGAPKVLEGFANSAGRIENLGICKPLIDALSVTAAMALEKHYPAFAPARVYRLNTIAFLLLANCSKDEALGSIAAVVKAAVALASKPSLTYALLQMEDYAIWVHDANQLARAASILEKHPEYEQHFIGQFRISVPSPFDRSSRNIRSAMDNFLAKYGQPV